MPTYRIYHVQLRGTVIPRGEFSSETDGSAMAKLVSFASPDLSTELWEGSRYVGQIPQRAFEERR